MRTTIRDSRLRIIGYIEEATDGRQKALDARLRILGYYEPKRRQTLDAGLRIVAHGNVLARLVYEGG